MTELLTTPNQYAYLRTSPEEDVLVVLNRAGGEKPIQIDVDDMPMKDGLPKLKDFPAEFGGSGSTITE